MNNNFDEREAARQELRKQQDLAGKEKSKVTFNADWHRKQVLAVRPEPLPVALLPWSVEDPLFNYHKSKFMHKNRLRSSLCTCHDGTLPTPCVPCHYAVKWNRSDMLPASLSAVSLLILKDFHKIIETQGKYKATRYYLCRGEDCSYCGNEVPTEFGLRRYLELNKENKIGLLEVIETAKRKCAGCGEGVLLADDYLCPECNGAFEADGDVTDVLSSEVVCPHCSQAVYPDLGYLCTVCDSPEELVNPFECAYSIRLNPQITGQYLFEVLSVNTIEETIKAAFIYKRAPLPFSLFLLTQSLTEQAKALALNNPFDAQDQKCLDDMVADLIIQANHRFVEAY